jgi:hypothetical protein
VFTGGQKVCLIQEIQAMIAGNAIVRCQADATGQSKKAAASRV